MRPVLQTSYNDGQLTPVQGWNLVDAWAERGMVAWKAETAAELAEAAGIDADALAATIEAYNGYVAAGEDADFGRDPATMLALEGTLYAIMSYPAKLLTNNGCRVDVDARVLDVDGEPIPGLYAGGEATSTNQFGPGYFSSCFLNLGATLGYQAANHIADEYLA